MKKLLKSTMIVILVYCLAAWTMDVFAAETTNYTDPDGRQLVLYHNTLTMRKGAGTLLEAKIVSAKKEVTGKVIWSVKDSDVVTVSEEGLLCAVNDGSAVVTATLEGTPIKKECRITVVSNPTVTVSEEKLVLEQGDTVDLSAEIIKAEADNKNYSLSWNSTNEKVAEVDQYGKVTIIGAGTATIRVSVNGTISEAACRIISLQKGRTISRGASADRLVTTASLQEETTQQSIVTDNAGNQYRRGEKIGDFVITGYCTQCNSCGPRATSSGETATAGVTVAVKKGQIPLGTKIVIGNHVYTAEDVHGNRRYSKVIDVFFGTRHGSECFLKSIPVYYAK